VATSYGIEGAKRHGYARFEHRYDTGIPACCPLRVLKSSGCPSIDMTTPESIKNAIAAGLACDRVEVRGDGEHFEALIVSSAFDGLNRVKRHQLVYGALGERMREEIHALSMTTVTPEEWGVRQRTNG
jgi:acid stress-induced BolA-like protein IbaG/YrbA